MSKKKILIVEDERIIAEDLNRTLTRLGYEVTGIASSSQKALEMAEANIPDLALMDVMLRGKTDGITTAMRLNDRYEIPSIYLTAYADKKLIEKAKISAPYSYIIKPFDEKELHTNIEIAIERSLANRKINRMNVVLKTIRDVNQLIVQERDRRKMIRQACEILTGDNGYPRAWIVLLDNNGQLTDSAQAGWGKHFQLLLKMIKKGDIPVCGQKALNSNETVFTDKSGHCRNCPFQSIYPEYNNLTIALKFHGTTFGLLSVAIPERTEVDEGEMDLFQELAGDISFSLHDIGLEEKRIRSEKTLNLIMEGTSSATGKDFFKKLVKIISQTMDMEIAFITRKDHAKPGRVKSVAMWLNGQLTDNIEWDVKDTPCKRVIAGKTVTVSDDVAEKYPKDIWLQDVKAKSYLAVPVVDSDGNVAGHMGVIDRHIMVETERLENILKIFAIRAGSELQRLQAGEELESVFISNPLSIMTLDEDRRIKRSNAAAQEYWNMTAEEIIGKRPGDVLLCIHHLDSPEGCGYGPDCKNCLTRNSILDTFNDQQSRQGIDAEMSLIVDGKGHQRMIRLNTSFFDTLSGPRVMVVFDDITEEKKTEKALVESEKKFRSIFESFIDVYYRQDKDGLVTMVSPSIREYGYEPEDIIGSRGLDYYADQSEQKELTTKLIKEGIIKDYEVVLKDSMANPMWVSVNAKLLYNNKGKIFGIEGVLRNVTKRKKAEEQLMHRADMELLIANVSSNLVKRSFGNIDSKINEALGKIGTFSGVDRAYVFHFDTDAATMDNTHEWCAKGIEHQIENLKDLPVSIFPWWMEKLNHFENIHIPRVSDLPKKASAEKEILESQDIQSLLVVPMIVQSKLTGFIGFDSVKREREWSEEDIILLRLLGETIAVALEQNTILLKLKESENSFRGIYNNASDAIYVQDREGRFLDVNQGAVDMYGYTKDYFIGKTLGFLSAPGQNDLGKIAGYIRKTFQGEPQQFAFWGKRKNGEIFPKTVRLNKSEYLGQEAVIAFAQDVTESRRAEDALKESEEKYRLIVENAHNGIEITQNDRIIFSNARFAEMLGYTIDEIENLSFDKIFTKEALKETKIRREKRKAGILKSRDYETTLRKKDGGIITVEIKYEIIDYKNKPATFAIIRDITEQKRAENALKESEEKFRSVIEQSNDGIYVLQDDRFVFINPRYTKLTGYELEEISDKDFNFREMLTENGLKVLDERFEKQERGEEVPNRYIFESMRKDGQKRNLEVSVTTIDWQNKPATLGIVSDVTERIKDRMELQRALQKAKQGEKVKSLFMANMSHEIRTPLNAILGFTELIESSTRHLVGKEEQEFFDTIRDSGQRLMHTVHEVLDISQIEAGTYDFKLEELDLCQLVPSIVKTCQPVADQKGLTMSVGIHLDSALIKADKNGVTQSISNIIDNAIKYTNEGKITVSLKQKAKHYVLTILDTGIGISNEYIETMFKAFTQESEGYTKKFQGIGLGMAITKSHLDLNQIDIRVKSKKNVGTTFTLTFNPMKKQAPKKKQVKRKEAVEKTTTEAAERPLILLVEDDFNSQRLMEFFLKAKYDILLAESVNGAKEQLKKGSVELVLLDLSLIGNEDGLDLVRWMRKTKIWKKTPVIATTAHAFSKDKENCLAAGCDDYLSKPIKREKLFEKIGMYR